MVEWKDHCKNDCWTQRITFEHEEQLLGESAQIGLQIILLPSQLTGLVIQSNFVAF